MAALTLYETALLLRLRICVDKKLKCVGRPKKKVLFLFATFSLRVHAHKAIKLRKLLKTLKFIMSTQGFMNRTWQFHQTEAFPLFRLL